MPRLHLDVRVLRSPELAAHTIVQAIRAAEAGNLDAAARGYREAVATRFVHPDSWTNLAALAIALDDAQGARRHALRALELARDHADAWVNLGVASWHAGVHREGAQATVEALRRAPALEAASLNLSLMLQAAGQVERAHAVLGEAARRAPDSLRVQEAAASLGRLLGQDASVRVHALAALRACARAAHIQEDESGAAVEAIPERHDGMLLAMHETCMRLDAAGIAQRLIGGVVLGIARQGEPFAGDKDIEIALADDVDRAMLDALFADGYRARRLPATHAASSRWHCMGFVHAATGIGIELSFLHVQGDMLRQSVGWPDELFYDHPVFASGSLRWRGRDWPAPAPLDAYLASHYGDDWRSPWREVGDGRRFDKRWFDARLSCPGLAAESVPRAVNLGLLRLLAALKRQQWPKALALCDQILAREGIGEVEAIRLQLLRAGIR